MKLKRSFYGHLLWVIVLLSWACTGTKKLGSGEFLYTGAELRLQSEEKIPSKNQLTNELTQLFKPDPNGTLFGMRPKVWIYQHTQDSTPNKGLKSWINNKIGEAPVLLQEVNPRRVQRQLDSKLFNLGYFNARVDYNINRNNKTANITYSAELEEPYRIDTLVFPDSTKGIIQKEISRIREESLIEPNSLYNAETLIKERDRIDNYLKNQGFYYFAPEYLIYEVDTTIKERKVNLFLKVNETTPDEAITRFVTNPVTVNPNYALSVDSAEVNHDTLKIKDYRYILTDRNFNPEVIVNSVFLRPDSVYSQFAHQQTLNRLMGLGVFQFVNIRFQKQGDDQLHTTVQLTPLKRKSIRLEAQAVAKSNNYVGPNLSASFRNRNFMGGAELFELKINSGYEVNFGQEQQGLNSYEIGLESNLYVPRFIVPFFDLVNKSSYYVPKTRFRFEYRHLNRLQFFKSNSFNFSLGYIWNETKAKRHELYPLDINYFQLSDTSGTFSDRLNNSEYLQRSFEEQFILSTNYSYIYNTQYKENATNTFYFHGNIDVSGNLMQLLQSAFRERAATSQEPFTIFGTQYSQYSKMTLDFRYYYNLDQKNKIASRILVGAGVPYGNSTTLPFVKQYFIGGTNSIRAFGARSVGPGTYHNGDDNSFFDQSGDIKLEGNLEYRFPIYSVFKGAVFLDAGNIWLMNQNEDKSGGKFRWDQFMDQLAVGTGAGLRIDASFFVLRFDFGLPLRELNEETNQFHWVFDDIDFKDIVLNIGIGYPF